MENRVLVTSESVGKGHPDKICDQIADLVLDECLKQDKDSRVACEVFASNRLIVIGGEITTKAYVDVIKCAWSVLLPLGYNESDFTILSNINTQSPNIAQKVDINKTEIGAGDQGVVYGYATNETKEMLPLSVVLSHKLVQQGEKYILANPKSGLKFDMKSQVTVDCTSNNPQLEAVVFSIQHDEKLSLTKLKKIVKENIVDVVVKDFSKTKTYNEYINHGGTFIIGGPVGDTGLTGRKIIVDTYGSIAHHGGGAFSGKDYTKVDRSGAYFARYVAKNIVAANFADKCEVALSFCIGKTKPVSVNIETFGTEKIDKSLIIKYITTCFDFELYNIIDDLKLKLPQYSQTSVYGHFGKNNLNWEKTDKVKYLRKLLKDGK